MNLAKIFSRVTLAGVFLFAVASEILTPSMTRERAPAARHPYKAVLKTAGVTIALVIIAELIAGIAIVLSGVYNIAADQPHFVPVAWLFKTTSRRSVYFHTVPERPPNLHDRDLVSSGLALFRKNCQGCHGAPGVPADAFGHGLNPQPPQLEVSAADWTDVQLYWIVSHGLKMSGMPGFDERLNERDRWALVAFILQMSLLSPADFKRVAAAADRNESDSSAPWISRTDFGFRQLEANGKPSRGRELLRSYGCISCHTIPHDGSGLVGPPLSKFAERQYIAGVLVNAPSNLVAWIRNPKRFKPMTDMPNLGISETDALDLASYLYTLGSTKRLMMLKRAAGS